MSYRDAQRFREIDLKKEHTVVGDEKTYKLTPTSNDKRISFFRADVRTLPKKATSKGILSPHHALKKELGLTASSRDTLEGHLTRTSENSPYVSLTSDMAVAYDFLKKRMAEGKLKEGYIYEIIPEKYIDARDVIVSARDSREGRNKNREIIVPGIVHPHEIQRVAVILDPGTSEEKIK